MFAKKLLPIACLSAALAVSPPAQAQIESAEAACLAAAGSVDAGVPASTLDAKARRAALAAAQSPCSEAAAMEGAGAEVLFHAASVAQAKGDAAGAFALFEKAAALGLAAAETRLGDLYLFGHAPGGENAAEAVAHYQKAAEQGDAPGMTTLALLYRIGRGVPRDTARMVALLTEAAEAGYHFAQYRLAQTYLSGEGIPGRADAELGIPDATRAAPYFTQAAEAGNMIAALELAALYADPTSGLPDNPGEQARLTRLVSRTGHPPAIASMGVLYETGRGVEQSAEVAAGLYVKALETGEVVFDAVRDGAPGGWDRDTAMAFQTILKERGHYAGGIDGIMGRGTAAAAAELASPE